MTSIDATELNKCHQSKDKRGGRRAGAGRKPGFESVLRKTGHPTKTARVPIHLNVQDVLEGLELLHSEMTYWEQLIQESVARSRYGRPSNRFEKVQTFLDQLRAAFPRSYFETGKWAGQEDERLPVVVAAMRAKAERLQRFSDRRRRR